MKRLLLMLALGWACSGIGLAQAPDTLFISASQVVHLRFASELKYVNLGSRDLVAKIVDGSKDFVAVKAREPFEGCTSMSCLEATGEMHSFVVAYREHPSRLNIDTFSFSRPSSGGEMPPVTSIPFDDLIKMKQELYHIGVRGYGIEILCENIFYKDDVLFLLVSVRNDAAVSYELSTPRFAVESKRLGRRGLQYEKAVLPKQSYGLGTVPPGGTGKLVFTFDKLALLRRQVFRVYFYEKGGARNLVMTVGVKDINKAKML